VGKPRVIKGEVRWKSERGRKGNSSGGRGQGGDAGEKPRHHKGGESWAREGANPAGLGKKRDRDWKTRFIASRSTKLEWSWEEREKEETRFNKKNGVRWPTSQEKKKKKGFRTGLRRSGGRKGGRNMLIGGTNDQGQAQRMGGKKRYLVNFRSDKGGNRSLRKKLECLGQKGSVARGRKRTAKMRTLYRRKEGEEPSYRKKKSRAGGGEENAPPGKGEREA